MGLYGPDARRLHGQRNSPRLRPASANKVAVPQLMYALHALRIEKERPMLCKTVARMQAGQQLGGPLRLKAAPKGTLQQRRRILRPCSRTG